MAKVLILVPDGLHADVMLTFGSGLLPSMWQFRQNGVGTDRAITLYDYSVTTPCQCSLMTGYPVNKVGMPFPGHKWSTNETYPPSGVTVQSNAGYYVNSMWDVAHDAGLRTVMIGGKARFNLFGNSWASKLSFWQAYQYDDSSVLNIFINDIDTNGQADLTEIHFGWPDEAGHGSIDGWSLDPGSPYGESVKLVDSYIGTILARIDDDTTVILVSDHGGKLGSRNHGDSQNPDNFLVPLWIMGPAVTQLGDLYSLNPTRQIYLTNNPPYQIQQNPGGPPLQPKPIRNAEVANIACNILGLGRIPYSMFNGDLVY